MSADSLELVSAVLYDACLLSVLLLMVREIVRCPRSLEFDLRIGLTTLGGWLVLLCVGLAFSATRGSARWVLQAHYGVLTGLDLTLSAMLGVAVNRRLGDTEGRQVRVADVLVRALWSRQRWLELVLALLLLVPGLCWIAPKLSHAYVMSHHTMQRLVLLDEAGIARWVANAAPGMPTVIWSAARAGLTEEILFRMGMFSLLIWLLPRKKYAPWLAVFLTAAVWVSGHYGASLGLNYSVQQGGMLLVLGMCLGFFYLRYGLILCMVTHFGAYVILQIYYAEEAHLLAEALRLSLTQ